MRERKDSPWNFYEPVSFRKWLKKSMLPLGYDKALKKKERLAVAYFFASLATLNMVVWSFTKHHKQVPTVTPENSLVQDYEMKSPQCDDKNIYIVNVDNLKFRNIEHINKQELEKRRLER